MKALEALANVFVLRRNILGVGLGRETTLAKATEACLDLGGFESLEGGKNPCELLWSEAGMWVR